MKLELFELIDIVPYLRIYRNGSVGFLHYLNFFTSIEEGRLHDGFLKNIEYSILKCMISLMYVEKWIHNKLI